MGLIVSVVVPIVAAQVLRQWRPVGEWATRRKHSLSTAAQIGVLLMVLVGAVECGVRVGRVSDRAILSAGNLIMMVLAVTAVHAALLILGLLLSRIFGIARQDAIAVAFSGSQKTLMVGAYVAMAVGPLAILPMVAYHAAQLVVDTLVADWWRGRGED